MSPAKTAISPRSSPLRTFRQQPPTQAFLGELVFHPSPQTGRDEKRAPLKTSEWEAISPGATERFFVISMEFLSLMRRHLSWQNAPSGDERRETAVFTGYKTCKVFGFLTP